MTTIPEATRGQQARLAVRRIFRLADEDWAEFSCASSIGPPRTSPSRPSRSTNEFPGGRRVTLQRPRPIESADNSARLDAREASLDRCLLLSDARASLDDGRSTPQE
jgi:hypothetical protein